MKFWKSGGFYRAILLNDFAVSVVVWCVFFKPITTTKNTKCGNVDCCFCHNLWVDKEYIRLKALSIWFWSIICLAHVTSIISDTIIRNNWTLNGNSHTSSDDAYQYVVGKKTRTKRNTQEMDKSLNNKPYMCVSFEWDLCKFQE